MVLDNDEIHDEITNLLAQLSEQASVSIAIEARIMTVASNFLEEFGVDLDFVFNSGTAGYDPAINQAGQTISFNLG